MDKTSMTALISAFSRAYHSTNYEIKIFDDSVAKLLFSDDEYKQISDSFSAGIGFFKPDFNGGPEEALRFIVNRHLSPSPLGRAAFGEHALENAVKIGARQYVLLGSGYDTFSLRQPKWAENLEIFELDKPAAVEDKLMRIKRAGIDVSANVHCVQADLSDSDWCEILLSNGFSRGKVSCVGAYGIIYYLPHGVFESLLQKLSLLLPKGSSLIFDYPDRLKSIKKQHSLASAAGEEMAAAYSYTEMEHLLAENGFLIYEHLSPAEITNKFFKAYNEHYPEYKMSAFSGVNYCLAVKE